MRKRNFTQLNRHLRNEKSKKSTLKPSIQTNKVLIEAHRLEGVFVSKGVNDNLLTRVLEPGKNLYDDKKVTVIDKFPVEYCAWNPFKSKLAAGILCGADKTFVGVGAKVLYLGAKNASNLSHISDIIADNGYLFALSHRPSLEIVHCANQRANIFPIIDNPAKPDSYSMQMIMVDTIISDISCLNVPEIIGDNARRFLRDNGHLIMFIDAAKIDKSMAPETVFVMMTEKMRKHNFHPISKTYLTQYFKTSAMLSFEYRTTKPKKYKP